MKNDSAKQNLILNRRKFLATTGAAVAATFLPLSSRANTSKLKIGLIGCGWYGMVDLRAAFKNENVECLAICDVDSEHLANCAVEIDGLQGYKPLAFKDYRQLLQVDGLEAVIIATPPHWHALPFLAALERGLDIYCEKPLAYDIREGQVMVQAARQSDRIVQIGFQRRMSTSMQEAREFIQSGNIGKIIQVDVHIHYKAELRSTEPQNPPASLDWDAWCGPAPKLPYTPNIGHFAWRLEKAYGNGHLVDWGIHMLDATRWILGESMPKSVQAFGGNYYINQITTPDVLTVNFEFASCPVTWQHRLWGATEFFPEISNGILFYGEKGTVFVSDRRWIVVPPERGAQQIVHNSSAAMDRLIMDNFLQAVKTREQPAIIPQDGFYSTATTQLGMISYYTKSSIEWDLKNLQITNNDKAASLLKREYRESYQHPYRG